MDCHVTYEELAALAAGDLDAARAAEIERHRATCEACRRRLAALRSADAALGALSRYDPPAGAVLRARRALSRELRGAREPSPPERLERDERMDRVRRLIGELPERQREALVLYAFERMSYREIGEALDVPINTVKTLIHRARAALARAFE